MFLVDFNTEYKLKKDSEGNERHYNMVYGDNPSHIMDVFQPSKLRTGTLVILVHGGGWVMGSKAHMRNLQKFLLKHGIPSANINYRLVEGTITYKDQLLDIEQAISFIEKTYHPTKIILLGESAGGHLAMLLGYQNPERIHKIITFAGPTDFYSNSYKRTKLYKAYTQQVFAKIVGKPGQNFKDIKDDLKEASPIAHVSNVPTLTFQGTWDYLVNKQQSVVLNKVLKNKGYQHELVLIKRGNHTLRFIPYWRSKIIEPKLLKFILEE